MRSSKWRELLPKSYLYLKQGYSFSLFKKDLLAGMTVGIIALPLAMAFAIASGVSPEKGLYTAIVAGFLISALGGSRVQIGGPTGAFVVIIYAIIQTTGYIGLCLSTLIAGLLLILLGLFKVGSWIKYIPSPLITGFTTGIAVLIFSTQIKDFLGLQMDTPPAGFIDKWIAYYQALPTFQTPTLLVGMATLGLILFLKRFAPKLPWGIFSIALVTFVCWMGNLPVDTIYSAFGQISNHMPVFSWPPFDFLQTDWQTIFTNAITIAFLGGIESLLSAVVGDGLIGGRHRSNTELIAQGIANIGSILFGGIPATGAIARTAANVKTGGQTPIAGMIHALTLLGILLFFAPLVSQIPLAALAAVLIMVSWHMSEVEHFIYLFKAPVGDRLILLTTFSLTVFIDLTTALFVGMTLACFVFMKQMSQSSKASSFFPQEQEGSEKEEKDLISEALPSEIEVYAIQGPLFFGSTHLLKDLPSPQIFILHLEHVPMIDASGLFAIKELHGICQKNHTRLFLSGICPPIKKDLKKLGLIEVLKDENIFSTLSSAIKTAKKILQSSAIK